MSADRRLLLVHAHPDDETINNGATMARYAADGVQVTLLTCTLGEFGEILVPEMIELEWDKGNQLGGYRMHELAGAMAELGVTDHRFLGGPGRFHDSGMMGTPGNDSPRAFWRADRDPEVFAAAVSAAVAVIREVRPQVVVTYDENGGYGHPDHIMAHRVTMAAVAAADDPDYAVTVAVPGGPTPDAPPWQVAKVYWNVISRSALEHALAALRRGGTTFFGVDSVDDFEFVVEDAAVTTSVDASSFAEAKNAAMRAHATQISVDGPFFALSNNLGLQIWGIEQYRLVHGELGEPRDVRGHETDLFAGVS